MAQLDAQPTVDQQIVGSIPAGSSNILSFVQIDHEIFSILCLPLIQEGQLSLPAEEMCTSTG